VPHDVEAFAPAGDLSAAHGGGGAPLHPHPAAPRHPIE